MPSASDDRLFRLFVTLPEGYARSHMGIEDMVRRHVRRGGVMGPLELEACLLGLLDMESRQHNIAALILNEYFLDRPHCCLVAYASGL